MPRTIPLIACIDGERTLIGFCNVSDRGRVDCFVTDLEIIKIIDEPDLVGKSFSFDEDPTNIDAKELMIVDPLVIKSRSVRVDSDYYIDRRMAATVIKTLLGGGTA